MRKIPVQTPTANYQVILQKGMLATLQKHVTKLFPSEARTGEAGLGKAGTGQARTYFVVTSPEIWSLWAPTFLKSFAPHPPSVLFLPAGEKHKRLAKVEQLATELSAAGADRNSVLLAFGGGVIGDVTGFLAAIYMRGIAYIQIPTTLLAQVDSSVGGKTGVNLTAGKNLIGAFHHPQAVFIDTETLSTLPDAQLRAGLFESLKAGLIRDRTLFSFMEREREKIVSRDPSALERVLAASIRMKADVVGQDEHESGVRMVLNFGHTLGHAIEAVAGFGKVLHGEAIGWGMLAALEISRLRGLPASQYTRAVNVIRAYGLPPLPRLSADRLIAATAKDKKNASGQRRFILLKSIGEAYVTNKVTDNELQAGLAAILAKGRA